MTDITILKRTILWDYLSRDLPLAAAEAERYSSGNLSAIVEVIKETLSRFRFITAEIEDRELVDWHFRSLMAELREPAIYKLSDDYSSSPDVLIDREIKEVLDDFAHVDSRHVANPMLAYRSSLVLK